MTFAALSPDRIAVVTGGAKGIGLAACLKFAELGMRVVIVDLPSDDLTRATERSEWSGFCASFNSGMDID
ncbi:MAG: hypothetical protein COB93_10615 [Sneathiella sp.]|nr:MAG: hypothetical protein COB93_10615 [Sneathiella sp.]